MREIKQSAAANVMVFMADSTDHITGKTGLTLAVTVSKDGGAFASVTPTVTERGTGWYNAALATGDTGTVGDLVVRATSTGADPGERTLNVVANVEADTYGRVGTPTGASISADIVAVKTDTGNNYAIVNSGTYGNSALNTAIGTRLATSGYTAPDNTTVGTINTKIGTPAASVSGDIAAVKTDTGNLRTDYTTARAGKLDNLDTTVGSRLATSGYTAPDNTTVGTINTKLGTPAASVSGDIAAVKTDTGNLRTDYTTARAVKIDNLDATMSSRLATSGYTAPDNTSIGFIQKWILNKLVEGPANTWKLYDTDDVTVIKTWTWDVNTTTRSKAV